MGAHQNDLPDSTVIPSTVKAQVSVRIVPDQDLHTITESLKDHLRHEFDSFESPNDLKVSYLSPTFLTPLEIVPKSYLNFQIKIDREADWWLGELDSIWFRSLEQSVKDEWGVQPLHIREGGVCFGFINSWLTE